MTNGMLRNLDQNIAGIIIEEGEDTWMISGWNSLINRPSYN